MSEETYQKVLHELTWLNPKIGNHPLYKDVSYLMHDTTRSLNRMLIFDRIVDKLYLESRKRKENR